MAEGHESADDAARRVHDELIEAIYRQPAFTQSAVVWRGIRSCQATFGMSVEALSTRLAHEETIVLHAGRFVAASLDRRVARDEFTRPVLRGGAMLLQLVLRPGMKALPVWILGAPEFAYQREVLCPPGVGLRLASLRPARFPTGDRGIMVLRIEVTP